MSTVPTQDELRDFARNHLLYEVEMFSRLTARLLVVLEHDAKVGRQDRDWLDIETRNAQVESFAIHARALRGFLHEIPKPHPNKPDALARHYAHGWNPPALGPTLDVVADRVGQEVAHLSYGRLRIDEEAKGWPYGQMWLDIASVLQQFVAQASPELLPEDVATTIDDLTAPPSKTDTIATALSSTHGATSLGI
jgi:hypothetical protein